MRLVSAFLHNMVNCVRLYRRCFFVCDLLWNLVLQLRCCMCCVFDGLFLAFNAVMYHFCCTVAEYCLTGIVTLYWRLLFSGSYDYTDQCVGMHDSVWQMAGSACEVTSRRENSKVVYCTCAVVKFLPSVLWRCWLGGRKGIRPVKKLSGGCWCGYLSGARCRLAYGPADATATQCLLLQ